MNDPMNELLKLALAPADVSRTGDSSEKTPKSRLSPADRQRLNHLNTAILSEVKEREKMGKYETYRKKSVQAAAIAATLILGFGSVSTIAAYRFLNPSQVATETNNQKLAKAFQGTDALFINETQTCGDYNITLLGSTSGKNIGDTIPADIAEDEIYAVLALKRTDGAPLPKFNTPEHAKLPFFPSFYIKGLNPARYNLDSMNGFYTSCEKNGVYYYIVAMRNIEIFADKGIYVGLCSAGEDGDYNPDAYTFYKKSGKITGSKQFDGVNALFVLPVDQSKADPKQAETFLQNLNTSVTPQSAALTKEEEKCEQANKKMIRLADAFFETITAETIDDLCEITDSQICVPDKDGVFTYSFPIGDSDTGYQTEKVNDRMKDKTPGVLNIPDGYGIGSYNDHYYKIETMRFTAYKMNSDGTVTRITYRPNEQSIQKINSKYNAD